MKQKRSQKNKRSIAQKRTHSAYFKRRSVLHSLWVFLLIAGIVVVSIYTANTNPKVADALEAPAGKVWTPYFVDDFNGSSLDTSRWRPYFNVYGDSNNEEACLTPSNVTVSGGSMKITAKREYVADCAPNHYGPRDFTSGFIGSREQGHYYPAFAAYEIRAKLPHGQGLWPAFWLRHSDGSSRVEVDVMEYFHSQIPGKTSQTLHFPAEYKYNAYKVHKDFEAPTTNPGWHTWSVAIVPTNAAKTTAKFIFYTDGVKTGEYAPPSFVWLNSFDKNAMFDMAINLAVGGNYAGHPDDDLGYSRYLDKCLRPYNGTPPCNGSGLLRAVFPSSYEVDYVKVYKLEDAPTTPTDPPTDPGGNDDGGSGAEGDGGTSGDTGSGTGSQSPSGSDQNTTTTKPKTTNNSKPVVVAPKPDEKIEQGSTIQFSPEITSDPEVVKTIKKVEYLIDGDIVQTYTKPPYDLDTSALPAGKITVTQRITYVNGSVDEKKHVITIAKKDTLANKFLSARVIIPVIAGIFIIATLGVMYYPKLRQKFSRK